MDTIQYLIILTSICTTSLVTAPIMTSVVANKSNFEIKEAPILSVEIGAHAHINHRLTPCNKFILDVDKDQLFNKNTDIILNDRYVPDMLAEKGNTAVYIERNSKERHILAIKDKNENCNITSNISDIYPQRLYKKNKSFNKVNQQFKDEYLKQR